MQAWAWSQDAALWKTKLARECVGNNSHPVASPYNIKCQLVRDNASFAEAKSNLKTTKMCRQTLNYYQWVPYMLVLQGALFLLPHKLWKVLEEGKMKCISEGVRTGNKG